MKAATRRLLTSLSESEFKFLLFFELEYRDCEIAQMMGVSTARTSQVKQQVKAKCEQIFKLEAVGLEAIR